MDKHQIISLIQILRNGPYLIYLRLFQPTGIIFYYLLFIYSLIVLADILYRIFNKQSHAWLYVHLILFVPLFLYIGYLGITKKEIKYYYFGFLLAIGLAAFFYHLLKFFKIREYIK